MALFFAVGQSQNVDPSLAGAYVCKTTQSCYSCTYSYQCGQNCSTTCGVSICGPGCTTATGSYCCNSCALGYCPCTTTCTPVYCTGYTTCCNNVSTCNYLADAPTLVSPANGASSTSSSWTLAWSSYDPNSSPTSPMYFEVSVQPPGGAFANICNFTSAPACPRGSNSQGVSTAYSASDLGTYNWRVRAWDGWTEGSGNPAYSDYSATWSFTKIAAVPDIPNQISPANAASSNNKIFTLSWSGSDPDNAPTTPMYYEVSVQPSGGSFTNLCNFTTAPACPRGSSGQTVATSYTANQPGTFTWRVRAYDGANYSGYSSIRTFTYVNTPPLTPTLVAPVTGGYGITSTSLQWRSSDPDSGPNSSLDYELSVRSEDGSYISGFGINSGHTGTNNQVLSYDLSPAKDGLFYWKVRAWDGADYSSYSEERSVFIDYDCP